jgi:hypothetical protein
MQSCLSQYYNQNIEEDTVLGVGGGDAGGNTADYRGTAASNNDFSSFRYKCLTGFV